jgi:hypothetical protein
VHIDLQIRVEAGAIFLKNFGAHMNTLFIIKVEGERKKERKKERNKVFKWSHCDATQ